MNNKSTKEAVAKTEKAQLKTEYNIETYIVVREQTNVRSKWHNKRKNDQLRMKKK